MACEEQKESQCGQGTCESVGNGRDHITRGGAMVEGLS